VWGYATSNEANPFLAPTGLVRGSPYEFIVLRLSLSLKKEEYVRVSTFSRDAGGNHSTRLYDARELRDLWNKWGDDETSTPHMKRAETIDRWCLPSTGFTRHAGRAEYLIVLVGKKPLPKPVVVDVVVTLGDSEPNTFTFTTAPAKYAKARTNGAPPRTAAMNAKLFPVYCFLRHVSSPCLS